MTKDERDDLLQDANQIAYTAIKFTGLYRKLSSAEWDRLADQIATEVVDQIQRRCDEEFNRRQVLI